MRAARSEIFIRSSGVSRGVFLAVKQRVEERAAGDMRPVLSVAVLTGEFAKANLSVFVFVVYADFKSTLARRSGAGTCRTDGVSYGNGVFAVFILRVDHNYLPAFVYYYLILLVVGEFGRDGVISVVAYQLFKAHFSRRGQLGEGLRRADYAAEAVYHLRREGLRAGFRKIAGFVIFLLARDLL